MSLTFLVLWQDHGRTMFCVFCMACCLGHVLVLSRLRPRPLVILILSLLPSLCHLFPSLVSPFYNPLVFAVLCQFIVKLCEILPVSTLSQKNVLSLLFVNSLVFCQVLSSLVIPRLYCLCFAPSWVLFSPVFCYNKPCVLAYCLRLGSSVILITE